MVTQKHEKYSAIYLARDRRFHFSSQKKHTHHNTRPHRYIDSRFNSVRQSSQIPIQFATKHTHITTRGNTQTWIFQFNQSGKTAHTSLYRRHDTETYIVQFNPDRSRWQAQSSSHKTSLHMVTQKHEKYPSTTAKRPSALRPTSKPAFSDFLYHSERFLRTPPHQPMLSSRACLCRTIGMIRNFMKDTVSMKVSKCLLSQ